MLGVPTHLRMPVTGARWPRGRVCARLRTRNPERLRRGAAIGTRTGPLPAGHPSGMKGARDDSPWSHDGGPVVRGTPASGPRGENVALTSQRPWGQCGQRSLAIPVCRRLSAGADAGAVRTGGGWLRALREAGRVWARPRWPRLP
jgi:hypothetical protein